MNQIRPTIIGYWKSGKPIYQIAGGSEGSVELENPTGETYEPGPDDGTAVEPQPTETPWSKYLEGIPTSLTPVVEENYRKWDADVTRRFQTVHSEYAPLKPYEVLAKAGYDAEQLYQLATTLNEDPRKIYDALVANFAQEWGLNPPEQGQRTDDEELETPEFNPELQSLRETVDTMSDIMLAQHREQQEKLEDQQVDEFVKDLHTRHGEFDEKAVLGMVLAGVDPDTAVKSYQSAITTALQQSRRPSAPRLLGSGGGVPTEQVDLRSPRARKEAVAQMLQNANRE